MKKNESQLEEQTVNNTEQSDGQAETKFSIEQLRGHALPLFGITVSTFDGATYGLKGEFTVLEMKGRIDEWLKKEVK